MLEQTLGGESMTLKKASLLLLSGFALGLCIAVRGWSDPMPTRPSKMMDYAQPQGLYRFRYPSSWKVSENEKALLIKSPGDPGLIGVFGIVRIADTTSIHDAVLNEFKQRPADLTQSDATVAGLHATKLVGPKKGDPSTKMVEYYIELPNGKKYYVLLMAPLNRWG